MQLSEIKAGEFAIIITIENIPLRLLELGLLKGEKVKILKKGIGKGPILVKLKDKNIAISHSLAEKIKVNLAK